MDVWMDGWETDKQLLDSIGSVLKSVEPCAAKGGGIEPSLV